MNGVYRRPTETIVIDFTSGFDKPICKNVRIATMNESEFEQDFSAPEENDQEPEFDVSNKELEDHVAEIVDTLPEIDNSKLPEVLEKLAEKLEGKHYDIEHATEFASELLF